MSRHTCLSLLIHGQNPEGPDPWGILARFLLEALALVTAWHWPDSTLKKRTNAFVAPCAPQQATKAFFRQALEQAVELAETLSHLRVEQLQSNVQLRLVCLVEVDIVEYSRYSLYVIRIWQIMQHVRPN